jgi:hypothetical protein
MPPGAFTKGSFYVITVGRPQIVCPVTCWRDVASKCPVDQACMAELSFVGVGSRSEFMAELTQASTPGSPKRLLALFRFYGLARLTTELGQEAEIRLLRASVRGARIETGWDGRLYRPRNDELAVLFTCPLEPALDILDIIRRALNELGAPEKVEVEAGIAILPDEAVDAISALRRADQRLRAGEREAAEALERRRTLWPRRGRKSAPRHRKSA